ncbi:transposase zinc-binding domain-containing protein [Serratia ficaria]|uniref:transposase zinc-binding domain-containing protein n=1 Tax=Serratia ficaria TaxID=61651 RepID=UPI0020D199D9|nr:transposase zinc-binding domain-containing protein [Serratia ficaria]
MYIPRPAKLLFQHDDGWSRYLDKHGDTLSDWTKFAVERMPACGTCLMGVHRYCCASPDCTHARFFCHSCCKLHTVDCRTAAHPARLRLAAHHVHHAASAMAVLQQQLDAA